MGDLPDPRRTIGNLIQLGTIETVDLGDATCRVRVGDIVTGDICWLVQRAGRTRTWSPPTVGEQCLLLCPEGDIEAGLAVLGLFSDANPAPSSDDVDLIRFGDGSTIAFDATAPLLSIKLAAGTKAEIDAPAGLKIAGPVEIDGPVKITGAVTIDQDAHVAGTLTADADVVGAGKSLKGHLHTGVQGGSGVSGPPQ